MSKLEWLYIEIPAIRPGSLGAFGFSALLAAVATVLRIAIEPFVAGVQYITFFPVVIVTTLISGVGAGFFSSVLCATAAWYFVLPPQGSFYVAEWQELSTLGFFLLVATTNVLMIGVMRLALARYRELSRTLEERVERRSKELSSAKESLAQAQKMEAVGQLTGGLAHDFNNMLGVVIGNLDMMRRRLAAGDTKISKYIDNAMEGSQRAAGLIQRLLAFARHQPLSPTTIDVNQLVVGMSELLRRTLGETIKVECVLAGGIWNARVDPGQLEAAIVNLAVNARDAMSDGGALTIETMNAHLDDEYARSRQDVAPGQYVVVAVSDTGSGMSTEISARAVEPFFTTKGPGKGTGLGLSQVYGFVKQSGGHLSIYSELGRGTTVRLYLPRASGAPAEKHTEQVNDEEIPIGAPEQAILVVDDEEHMRRMSVAALRELGYKVYEAATGSEALSLLAEGISIDLLFTDIVMPIMGGPKLADAAQERQPNLKILYTTGYTRNAIVHDGTVDPGVHLIVKPFTLEQLARKVRSLLG